jgi:signal peptidase
MKSIIKTRFDRRVWLVVLALAVVYLLANLVLPQMQLDSSVKSYILPALLWGLVTVLIWRLPRYWPSGKSGSHSGLIQMGLVLGLSQIVIYGLAGLFSGFGKSPSSFTPINILLNLIITSAMLIGMESSRAWLLNHAGKRIFLSLILVSSFLGLLSFTPGQLTGMKANMATISFAASYLLPALAESLLASLLAMLAGPKASIAYRGLLLAFWVFCPILPDLSWSARGLIGVLVPLIALIIVWNIYAASNLHGKPKKQSSGGLPVGWIITSVVSVLIIWFAVGIFPVHPVMIATGSMSPVIYAGDIVIIAKSSEKNFEIGDIIEFRKSNNVNVVHRIVAINNSGDQKTYTTKGDANDSIDTDPVIPENVVGKVVYTVPKLGWAASAVKSIFVRS